MVLLVLYNCSIFIFIFGVKFIIAYNQRKKRLEIIKKLNKYELKIIKNILVSKDKFPGFNQFFGSNYKSNIIYSENYIYAYPIKKYYFLPINFPILTNNINSLSDLKNVFKPYRITFYSDYVHVDYKEFDVFNRLIINFKNQSEKDELLMISEWVK